MLPALNPMNIDQRLGLPVLVTQVAPTGVGPATVFTSILPLLSSESGVALVTVLTVVPARVL